MEQHEWRVGEQAMLALRTSNSLTEALFPDAGDGSGPPAGTLPVVIAALDGSHYCKVRTPTGAILRDVSLAALRPPLPAAKNVREIIVAYLRERGLDGLAGDECGCAIDELAICDHLHLDNCVPARMRGCLGQKLCGLCDHEEGDTCFAPVDEPWPPARESLPDSDIPTTAEMNGEGD
jgi:hypothetical protein